MVDNNTAQRILKKEERRKEAAPTILEDVRRTIEIRIRRSRGGGGSGSSTYNLKKKDRDDGECDEGDYNQKANGPETDKRLESNRKNLPFGYLGVGDCEDYWTTGVYCMKQTN
ncbi:uncharacterized protein G2W53_043061 [Senna tora]|uniref:Uncharacterized protein n=1 Tax=Senna tora TaxID=362788 RepID=A0A834SGC4_9FABA|nr:uncharacterized protein G2W53_043061 [Senna tora]